MPDISGNDSKRRFECLGKGASTSIHFKSLDTCLFQGELILCPDDTTAPLSSYNLETQTWQPIPSDKKEPSSADTDTCASVVKQSSGNCAIYKSQLPASNDLFFKPTNDQIPVVSYINSTNQSFFNIKPPTNNDQYIQSILAADSQLYVLLDSENGLQQIYVTDDPINPEWVAIQTPSDIDNEQDRISHLASFHGRLYLTTDNTASGFQLWCYQPGEQKHQWQLVLGEGAYEYSANAYVTTLLVSDDRLLIATAAEPQLIDLEKRPVGPELISVDQDNNWMLLMGTTRPTDDGLAVPAACMGRGFDNRLTTHITALCKTKSHYLAATFSSHEQQQFHQLWQSTDLYDWEAFPLESPFRKEMAVIGIETISDGFLLIARDGAGNADTAIDDTRPTTDAPIIEGLPVGMEIWLLRNE